MQGKQLEANDVLSILNHFKRATVQFLQKVEGI